MYVTFKCFSKTLLNYSLLNTSRNLKAKRYRNEYHIQGSLSRSTTKKSSSHFWALGTGLFTLFVLTHFPNKQGNKIHTQNHL
jgi:hypothetical protein